MVILIVKDDLFWKPRVSEWLFCASVISVVSGLPSPIKYDLAVSVIFVPSCTTLTSSPAMYSLWSSVARISQVLPCSKQSMSNIVMYNSGSATTSLVPVDTTENRFQIPDFSHGTVGNHVPIVVNECSRRSYAVPPYRRASVKRNSPVLVCSSGALRVKS